MKKLFRPALPHTKSISWVGNFQYVIVAIQRDYITLHFEPFCRSFENVSWSLILFHAYTITGYGMFN